LFLGGSPILFHWISCLFLCQYYAVFVTMTLQYNLKSGGVILPVLLVLLRIAFYIWRLTFFHMNFKIDFSMSAKNDSGILMGIALCL
jgi:hypothetical protein